MDDFLKKFPQIGELPVDTWTTFRYQIEAFQNEEWVFRGQADAQWTLESSIERYSNGSETMEKAQLVIEEFKERAHNFSPDGYEPRNTVEWLSLMQQHGAPTRFLDFTVSPYIAAYFAIEACQEYDSGALYAINRQWLRRRLVEAVRSIETDEDSLLNFHNFANLYDFRRNLVRSFDSLVHIPSIDAILPIDVTRPNRRQIAQKGVYLCACDLRKGFMDSLTSGEPNEIKGNVHKIVFPSTIQSEALFSLRRLNIERATLFPDLDGFGASLKDYLKEWPHRRRLIADGAGGGMLFSSTMGQDEGHRQP